MSLYTKLTSVLNKKRGSTDYGPGDGGSLTGRPINTSTERNGSRGSSAPSAPPRMGTPRRIPNRNGKGVRIDTKTLDGLARNVAPRRVLTATGKLKSHSECPSTRQLPPLPRPAVPARASKLPRIVRCPSDTGNNIRRMNKNPSSSTYHPDGLPSSAPSAAPKSPARGATSKAKTGLREKLLEAHEKRMKSTSCSSSYLLQKAVSLIGAANADLLSLSTRPHSLSNTTPEAMKIEGPMDLSPESFDLHKMIAQPQEWTIENKEKSLFLSSLSPQELEQARRLANFKARSMSRVQAAKKQAPATGAKSAAVIGAANTNNENSDGDVTRSRSSALAKASEENIIHAAEIKSIVLYQGEAGPLEEYDVYPDGSKELVLYQGKGDDPHRDYVFTADEHNNIVVDYSDKERSEITEEYLYRTDENNGVNLTASQSAMELSHSCFHELVPRYPIEAEENVRNNNARPRPPPLIQVSTEQQTVEPEPTIRPPTTTSVSTSTNGLADADPKVPPERVTSRQSNYENSLAAYGVYLRNQDSIMIPLEIEEQFAKVLAAQNKISAQGSAHTGSRFTSQSTLPEYLPTVPESEEGAESDASTQRSTYGDVSGSSSYVSDRRTDYSNSEGASSTQSFVSTWSSKNETKESEYEIAPEEFQMNRRQHSSRVNFQDSSDNNDRQSSRASIQKYEDEMVLSVPDPQRKGQKYRKKMKGLVLSRATGVNISATKPSVVSVGTGGSNSVMHSGFPEDTKIPTRVWTATANTSGSGYLPTISNQSILKSPASSAPSTPVPQMHPTDLPTQTYKRLGADSGFPSKTEISSFIGNLVQNQWTAQRRVSSATGNNVDIRNHPLPPGQSKVDEYSDDGGLIGTAYDFLSAGLTYASKMIGDETELDYQEDFVRYNGYKIKVYGKELLLESVHMNRDFQINSENGRCCKSIHSFISLQPHTLSKEKLEQDARMGDNGSEKRVRIVVRITGPSSASQQQPGEAQSESNLGSQHLVRQGDGKWFFILNSDSPAQETNEAQHMQNGTFQERYAEIQNAFVEIGCPTGVNAGMIQYGLLNGLLYIDAP